LTPLEGGMLNFSAYERPDGGKVFGNTSILKLCKRSECLEIVKDWWKTCISRPCH